MKLAQVILDIPTQALDAPYTYIVIESDADKTRLDEARADAKRVVAKETCGAKATGGTSRACRMPIHAKPRVEQLNLADLYGDVKSCDFRSDAADTVTETDTADTGAVADTADTAYAADADISSHATDGSLPHEVSEHGSDGSFVLEVGCAVLVPFGNRKAVGFVVGLLTLSPDEAFPEDVNPAKLKAIVQVLTKPYFTEIGAECARHLADMYIAPFSSSIRLFMPPGGIPRMERINGHWELTQPVVQEVDERWVVRLPEADSFVPRKRAVKQQQVLEALKQGDLRVVELTAEYGQLSSTLTSLEKKGVIRIEQRRRLRNPHDDSAVFSSRVRPRPVLTEDQRRAVDAISQAASRHDGDVVLIDGVTGSGKTEVYLCAIEQALSQGKGAVVLVPEISLTPQTVARFRGRFGDTVAVLHSRMSQGERFDQWDAIRSGQARVVVGARSALFAPMKDVGIIIIDEEHESSYKQDQAPRYVTRDVAEWLARAQGAVMVLGSATPSLEALHRVQVDERWHKVDMPNRANGKPLPAIQVVDMAREFGGGNRSMFSRALQSALFETIDRGEKAVLLLNQRGFAQFLLCRDCGYVPECSSCSTSLTYHEYDAKLVCHHCGYETRVPAVCPKCGSPYLKRFGAGTQRVEAELRTLLADYDCEIIRMDADTTSRKGDHQRLLEQFAAAPKAVLLGTQMIAKGLDFDEVTLVGVINADTMLKLPDFRSSERTFDLIEQVAGRAGRAEKPGRVIVQTYSAQSVAIRAAAHYNREAFLEEELRLRHGLGYPPYVRLANVLIWGKDEARVKSTAQALYADLMQLIPNHEQGWTILPPTSCVLERLKGACRYHMVIKAPEQASIAQYVGAYFRKRKPDYDVRVSIDIDPVNLL